jgi:hypothetical protein
MYVEYSIGPKAKTTFSARRKVNRCGANDCEYGSESLLMNTKKVFRKGSL